MKKITKILLIILISLSFSIKNIKAEELPKVYFEGNIENMTSKKDERKIKLTYVSKNLNFESYTLIKIDGCIYFNLNMLSIFFDVYYVFEI